jgi:hypothetical protein
MMAARKLAVANVIFWWIRKDWSFEPKSILRICKTGLPFRYDWKEPTSNFLIVIWCG